MSIIKNIFVNSLLLLFLNTTLVHSEELKIPHPKLHERNFVLLPLYEISKDWLHPKKNKKISELLRNLDVNNLRSIKQL